MCATSIRKILSTKPHTESLACVSVLAASLLILSCGGKELPLEPPDPPVADIAVNPTIDTLTAVGLTLQLNASARDSDGNELSGKSFTWVSGNPDVASVSGTGLVTAVANGTATITASESGIEGSAAIIVAIAPDIVWHLETGTSHSCGAAMRTDGTLYMCATDGRLYAITAAGSVAWMYDTGSPFHSSPALGSNGTVYVGTEGGELHAVNPDGTQKWAFAAEGHLTSPALVEDGTVYFGTNGSDGASGNLYAINSDGSQRWIFGGGWLGPILTPPVIADDGTIYIVGAFDIQTVFAVNPDGTKKWEVFNQGASLPAIGLDGTLYFGLVRRDFLTPWGYNGTYVKAINPDGTLRWTSEEFPSGSPNSTPVIASDGTIYLASCGQWLNAYNPDGTAKWRSSIADDGEHEWPPNRDCEPSNVAVSADGTIFLAGASTVNIPQLPGTGVWRNRFFAFNSDGSMKWTLPLERPWSAAIGSDGTVYVGSADGVYAIVGGGGALANSPWPIFKGDQRNSGYAGSH